MDPLLTVVYWSNHQSKGIDICLWATPIEQNQAQKKIQEINEQRPGNVIMQTM